MDNISITIVGAGIIGLDVAYVLGTLGYGRNVTVVAEHFPGDMATEYTSPYAGANFSSLSGSDANALRWDKLGYAMLKQFIEKYGEAAGIKKTPSIEYWDIEPKPHKISAMGEYLEDFRRLPNSELPEGVKLGVAFTTLTIYAPKHLKFLQNLLNSQYGVKFVRRRLDHVDGAFSASASKDGPTEVVFNCTGNAAKTLPGVLDEKCYPTRGQILIAHAPHITENMMRHGKDYETYIIPRPFSGGQVILGGFMQRGNGSPTALAEDTESIVRRTKELNPEVASDQTRIIMPVVGLRPSRDTGARVEKEWWSQGLLIHNYGAGGTGYQAGLGMAHDAVDLLASSLSSGVRPSKL